LAAVVVSALLVALFILLFASMRFINMLFIRDFARWFNSPFGFVLPCCIRLFRRLSEALPTRYVTMRLHPNFADNAIILEVCAVPRTNGATSEFTANFVV
jgi:hypothetical protein